MFFNKRTEQETHAKKSETLEWDQGTRRSQSTRVIVKSWFYKAQPGLQWRNGGKVEFSFEGHARLGTTPNVPIFGDIEVLDEAETPRFLMDRWKSLPESVEGHASLASADNSGMPEQLYITLYCTREAFESVTRVFVAGFSAAGGKTALDVDFIYPDPHGEGFWKEAWQKQTLQVEKWDVRSSVER
ncbi:hypothetical protein [Pseudoduganella violaceinigra]|uniref:hypothetical protein n=1 Tax=Pseudoduganella violaceinigra TaxID=246602 RepID=UPI0004861CDF|nr:hypothetical protein [Pseudoduganella violaceinigra]